MIDSATGRRKIRRTMSNAKMPPTVQAHSQNTRKAVAALAVPASRVCKTVTSPNAQPPSQNKMNAPAKYVVAFFFAGGIEIIWLEPLSTTVIAESFSGLMSIGELQECCLRGATA